MDSERSEDRSASERSEDQSDSERSEDRSDSSDRERQLKRANRGRREEAYRQAVARDAGMEIDMQTSLAVARLVSAGGLSEDVAKGYVRRAEEIVGAAMAQDQEVVLARARMAQLGSPSAYLDRLNREEEADRQADRLAKVVVAELDRLDREEEARANVVVAEELIAGILTPQCDHEDLSCPPETCDWSGRDGRDG